MTKFAPIAAALTAAIVTASASAGIIVWEDFDYDANASLIGQGSASNGWSGAWTGTSGTVVDVSANPLAAAGVNGGDRALRTQNLNLQTVATRGIAASPAINNNLDLWISYLVRWDAGTKNNGEQVRLFNSGSNWDHRFFGPSPISTGDDFTAARSYTQSFRGGGEFGVGDTALIVVKLTSDGANWTGLDMWVNPTSQGATGTGDVTMTMSGSASWSTLPGLGITHRASNDTFLFDRLRVGEEFQDVAAAPAIPEPATLGMGLLGVGLLLLKRRR